MYVHAIKTRKVTAKACTISELLDESLDSLAEGSVLVVTSKIVALCEGRTKPIAGTDLQELVREEAEWFAPSVRPQNGYTFTIAHNMLTPNSGIDESNADNTYVLWPADPWASARQIRRYLRRRFGLQNVAVILSDSSFLPLRWGAVGLSLAYSGLEPLYRYAGQVDLFGRPLRLTRTDVVDGLAAAAVLVMGEGAEQMPLAVIRDVPRIKFVAKDPTAKQIAAERTPPSEDSFGPILGQVTWQKGGRASV